MVNYEKLFALFAKYNIRVTASMIVGLDADTKKTLEHMIQLLIRFKVSYAQFFLLMLLPGTKMREDFLKNNRIIDHNWDHQNGTVVTFLPKSFQIEELQDYYWELYHKFYSYQSIISRIFTLNNIKFGVKSIYVPLRSNLYFLKKLKRKLHPIEN